MSGYSGEEKALLPLLRITLQSFGGSYPADISNKMFWLVHTMERLL
jgi:hypothetical protein